MQQRRVCTLLLLAACLGCAAAATKTVKVTWQPPGNKMDEMDRPRLLNCGDTLQLVCPPGETHGVFKIANVSGACPKNYQPLHGDVLLPPTPDCDLKIKLKSGDDYFLTSQVPGECQSGMKMLVKVFCDTGATTTSNLNLNLGSGAPRMSNRTTLAYDNDTSTRTTGKAGNGAGVAGASAVLALLLGALVAVLW